MIKPDKEGDDSSIVQDFSKNIRSLEERSQRCYRRVKKIGWALGLLVMTLIMSILYVYGFNSVNHQAQLNRVYEKEAGELIAQLNREESLYRILEKKAIDIASEAYAQSAETSTPEQKLKDLDQILVTLEKVTAPDFSAAFSSLQNDEKDFTNSFTTIAFSVAAIGFAVLLIQILVQFMRYYARLAELYDAQADALRISNGDPKLAYEFISSFNPSSVELGSAPASVYEKALDVVSTMTKKNER